MSAARDFYLLAQGAPTVTNKKPKVTSNGKATSMRICIHCGCHQPHELVDGKYICVVCGPRKDA
jgi:hypothetical protein